MSSVLNSQDDTCNEFDLKALQGAWEQIDLEDSGVSNPPDEHGAPDALTTIEGHQFRTQATGQSRWQRVEYSARNPLVLFENQSKSDDAGAMENARERFAKYPCPELVDSTH